MASEQKAKFQQGDYEAFASALRKVLQVSHSDMKAVLEAEKKAKASKPRPSVHASPDKD